MAVKAVVFDIGNVLFDWHPRYLFEKMTGDRALADRIVRDVVTLEWHFQHDLGRNFSGTSAELIEYCPDFEPFIRAFGTRFDETIRGPVAGMHEIVRSLDDAAIPLFCITNFSHEFFPPFREKHAELFDRFQDIVVSGDEKIAKPDPAIYELARRRFGLARGEGIFVDDVLANAQSADRNGFIGHHFTGAAQLRATLEGHNLL